MPLLLYFVGVVSIILGGFCVLLTSWWPAGIAAIMSGILWLALGRIVDCLERLAYPERYAKPAVEPAPEPHDRMTVNQAVRP